jgi:hypothetical protein
MLVQRCLLPGLLCMSLSAAALAADYPTALRGRYAHSGGGAGCASPALVIEQSRRFNDVDATCTARAAAPAIGTRAVVEERCNREGREWSQRTVFELDAGMLKLTEGRDAAATFRSCTPGAAPASKPAATTAATPSRPSNAVPGAQAVNCKVSPGQAGVTTFLDSGLARSGNAVRDFDGYTFRATGRIQVKRSEVLVGQLVRADGTVSESKSWAMADEWECR